MAKFLKLIKNEKGATAIEYGLIAALIAVAAIAAMGNIGDQLGSTFNDVVRDPTRLQGQLDLCGRIAEDVSCLRVQVGPRPGPEAADALARHLQKLR